MRPSRLAGLVGVAAAWTATTTFAFDVTAATVVEVDVAAVDVVVVAAVVVVTANGAAPASGHHPASATHVVAHIATPATSGRRRGAAEAGGRDVIRPARLSAAAGQVFSPSSHLGADHGSPIGRRMEPSTRSPRRTTHPMKRTHIVAGLVAGLTAGAGAGFALTHGGSAGAAAGTADVAITASTDVSATDDADETDGRTDGERRIRDALAPLVTDGTLTDAQVDAVVTALAGVLPGGGHNGFPGGRDGARGGARFGGGLVEAAATALGLDVPDLMSRLMGGSTVADLAAAQGVEVQAVIDAMVVEAKAHLDEEVGEGDLTQDEADVALTEATDAITTIVNEGWSFPDGDGDGHGVPGMGGPGMGGHGHGRGDDDDGGDDGAAPTDAATIDTATIDTATS